MADSDYIKILRNLIQTWENEVIEFKEANDNFPTSDIGKYFSALSNEANLKKKEHAWLVFGVHNKTRKIVGTDYRLESERLQGLKMQISQNTEPTVTFRNIHEVFTDGLRVILFEIPSAPIGIPISWNGHYYSRSGESLVSLGLNKLDEIRKQTAASDWTAKVVDEARLEHLDPDAIEKAREAYGEKYSNRFSESEIKKWSVPVFLDRARLTIAGKITRTTLILLGKKESSHFLLPYPAQITWKLVDKERAYEHFAPPFLLSTSELYQKIRNYQIRILPENSLIPVEVSKYKQRVILEALHNCIAHQDYTKNSRIIVTEYADKLSFENVGSFYEGNPEDYIAGTKTPHSYRNSFLAQAMAELKMIDTLGYGIHEMNTEQAKRFFPLPDYDLSEPGVVKVSIYGKIFDPAYSNLLIQNPDLALEDIIALDRVQKKLPLTDEMIKRLRNAQLIEGRKPNFHISLKVAKVTDKKVDYVISRPQDDDYYAKLILDYLKSFGKATRQEINELLLKKLSDTFDDLQKDNKVKNLLTKLRRSGKIVNEGSRTSPVWKLAERNFKKK
ncbi:MAG: putative DNA binding domain-containing protein [Candidatus Delongbacteria bacterium]|nr:putative DNA binding domain-containing protein [Candidatus Delongbacteria bacterium]MCG2759917.1 putative DNA binding domain-containing protein [Candidatus Delongbacteria bacterium]